MSLQFQCIKNREMELNYFQELLSTKAIDVYYLNEKVYMKNWTDL